MNPKPKKKGHLKSVIVERSKDADRHPKHPPESNRPWVIPGICVFLAVITLAVFARTLGYGFVNFDDDSYVYKNSLVAGGLTLKGIVSAFGLGESDNWVPLTTISHMLDREIYGLKAGGHHLTNLLLHTISVILLFLVLREMTGAVWRSAFIAVVFAVHPLHVESVAWVSERKDCLSGLFFMLTLWAYLGYVRRPQSLARYLLVALLFAFGLMSKPMLVTLPLVLLLLDYWPLNRFSNIEPVQWPRNISVPARLILEKVPLLMLSIASCIPTLLAERIGIRTTEHFPLTLRVENALVSYVMHIERMFYPAKLAILYPYPNDGLPIWKIIGAFTVLVMISLGALLWRQKRPYFLVGWLWYLGMLVPVIGFVQVGSQALADRHTYLPQIGLSLMLVWFAAEQSMGWRNRRLLLSSAASLVILAMVISASHQVSYWKNSETLWTRTLEVTTNNPIAHLNLGVALYDKGNVDGAINEYEQALALDPDYATPHYDLGFDFFQKREWDKAIIEFQKALALDPGNAEADNILGNCFLQEGNVDEAIVEYQKALAIDPNYAKARYNPGVDLVQEGQVNKGAGEYQKALAADSGNSDIYCNLGNALAQKGRMDEAILVYQKALAIDPEDADLYSNLGNALAQKGQMDEAIRDYQKALAINPTNSQTYYNYGNALIQNGEMDEATLQFEKAVTIQPGFVEAQNNLARIVWMLANSPNPTVRNGTKAVELGRQSDQLAGGSNPMIAASLAAAYAETGNFAEAITNAQRALQLASSQTNAAMMAVFQAQLKNYQADSLFHAPGTTR